MATQPLFSPDLATLKKELRVSTLPAGQDGEAVFNQAVLASRTDFFRKLGKARVDVILAFPVEESPTTDGGIVRATARVTEVYLVRWHLMGSLPMLFMDAAGDNQELWNEESPFREMASDAVEQKRAVLYAMILENMDLLAGEEELGEETSIRIALFSPEEETIAYPGASAGISGAE